MLKEGLRDSQYEICMYAIIKTHFGGWGYVWIWIEDMIITVGVRLCNALVLLPIQMSMKGVQE